VSSGRIRVTVDKVATLQSQIVPPTDIKATCTSKRYQCILVGSDKDKE
jgi:hypothetical protein